MFEVWQSAGFAELMGAKWQFPDNAYTKNLWTIELWIYTLRNVGTTADAAGATRAFQTGD
jgi:hypothetical protein